MALGLWVISRSRFAEGDSRPHFGIAASVSGLDSLCETVFVAPFSNFIAEDVRIDKDMTGATAEDLRDRASWCEPSDGLLTLRALRDLISETGRSTQSRLQRDVMQIVVELDDCISKLARLEADDDLFHFARVML